MTTDRLAPYREWRTYNYDDSGIHYTEAGPFATREEADAARASPRSYVHDCYPGALLELFPEQFIRRRRWDAPNEGHYLPLC